MTRWPVDAPVKRVIKAFEHLGFRVVRIGNHVSMIRDNKDGSTTPLTIPNHKHIKASTLRSICTQAGISREDFLTTYSSKSKKA